MCRALHRQDRDSLLALCVNEREFREVLWNEFPQSRPATGLKWDDAWRTLTVRLLSGLGATGVDEVLMMPADLTVSRTIDRITRSLVVQGLSAPLPSLTWLDLPTTYHARDTIAALAAMVEPVVAVGLS